MGVKSTRELTRKEAERLWHELFSEQLKNNSPTKFMSNQKLEDILEIMNDANNGGEGFTNYRISDD